MTRESVTAFREWYDLGSRSESQPSAFSRPQVPRRWSTLLPVATASVRRTTFPLHGSGNPQEKLVSFSRRSRLKKWGPQGHPWRAGPWVTALQTAGVANPGQANSLIVKLNLIGNNGDAGKAQALLNEVAAFLQGGIQTQAEADALAGPGNILRLSGTRQ